MPASIFFAPNATAAIAWAEGTVAACEGRFEQSSARFQESIDIAQRFSLPCLETEVLLCWGRALAAAHDTDQADQKFDAAVDVYRRIAAGAAWIDRARAERARALSGSA